jgi:hypothetical protein
VKPDRLCDLRADCVHEDDRWPPQSYGISRVVVSTSLPDDILSCGLRVSRRLPFNLASYWFDAPVLRFGRFTVFN